MSEPIILNPEIKTARLLLRTPMPIPAEAAALAALFANPANTQYEPHKPSNPTTAAYLSRIAKWEITRLQGKSCFMAIERNGGSEADAELPAAVIGFGGINAIITDAETGRRTADVGVLIDSGEWGRGFGTEALGAMVRFAFEKGNVDEVLMETLAVNKPFQRVADGLGLDKCKRLIEGSFGMEVVYRFGKDEWRGTVATTQRSA